MSTPTHGADVEHLRATAQQICEAAAELIATAVRVGGALSTLTWNGPDAMRARQAWDTEHAGALLATARVLVDAGQLLLTEADQQEGASTADASAVAPPGPAGQSTDSGPTVAEQLSALTMLLGPLPLTMPSPDMVKAVLSKVPEPVRTAISGANAALNINTSLDPLPVSRASSVPVPSSVSRWATVLGVTNDLDQFTTAVRDGDLDGAIRSGGSLATTAVGRVSPAHGAVASLAWEGTYQFRDRVFTGSRWEENFVARNDAIADMVGPLAVPIGLGTFIVSGVETGWEKLTEVVTSDAPEEPPGGAGGR